MGGKAKPTKHTAKELQMKLDSQKDRGGGTSGITNRNPIMSTYTCHVCMTVVPGKKTLEQHFEGKHPKLTLDWAMYPDVVKETSAQTHHNPNAGKKPVKKKE